jgi:hypothetical protein
VIRTYNHREAAELNATLFVTLGDYSRLRDAAREVAEAWERDPDGGQKVYEAVIALRALATEPTI